MITRENKPIGIAISLNDTIINDELRVALMIEAYKNSHLSLGQLSKALRIDKKKALKMLSLMGVDAIDYNLDDDMPFINSYL